MFERYTDRARHAIVQAQEEARYLQSLNISSGHIFMALARDPESVAGMIFAEFGVDLDKLRVYLGLVTMSASAPVPGHLPFTDDARKVIELGLREALQLGHNYIAPEHLLLAACRASGNQPADQPLARIFEHFGFDREHWDARIKQKVYEFDAADRAQHHASVRLSSEPEPEPMFILRTEMRMGELYVSTTDLIGALEASFEFVHDHTVSGNLEGREEMQTIAYFTEQIRMIVRRDRAKRDAEHQRLKDEGVIK